MIDAKAFGAELADIVKTATAPLLRRIDQLEKKLIEIPTVRDGKDGADGRDGFGFDDLTFEQTGERSAVLRFARGEQVKEFAIVLPGFVDRGVWKDAEAYQPGDGVTYGGSFWIAQAGADGRPDTGKGWRLAVKKGRDGKDGRDGEKGLQGPEGRPGRDLTQLGGDGSKW